LSLNKNKLLDVSCSTNGTEYWCLHFLFGNRKQERQILRPLERSTLRRVVILILLYNSAKPLSVNREKTTRFLKFVSLFYLFCEFLWLLEFYSVTFIFKYLLHF